MTDYWDGVKHMQGVVGQVRERVREGAREGLWNALTNTLGVSNSQVPHEEGDLERDGEPSMADDRLLGAISYGRSADTKDYAERQHEDLTLHHDGGRNAKFLERALNSTRDQTMELVAAGIKRRLNA